MALHIGTRVGPYEVLSRIGAGGMGEVYRARDTELPREVAIKVLLPIVGSNADRLARFRREAQLLASLNHPNIAHIHGLADADGVPAFVMELVEGPTLADRILAGPIPATEALSIAKQIADALDAAHEHGIIHRDLKPANIKVRPDGIVKVLDFGLAKALDPPAPSSASAMSTMTAQVTQAGVILGTPAYMAPEQVRGAATDKSTDIWAFGCVLYEMLTGRPAFEGEGVAGVLASVLEREPDWTRLPANLPGRVHDLLRLCLEKNPKSRRRDAGDVRIDIERALADPPILAAGRSQTPRKTWLVGTIAMLAVVVLTIDAIRYLRGTPAYAEPEMRVEITPPPQSAPLEFALAPNGRSIVFVASVGGRRRLWLRALNEVDAKAIAGTDGAAFPFWSADSRSIGFFASRKLYRIDVGGGPPQELADAPLGRGGAWSADDTIVFAPSGDDRPLMRIAATGGEPVAVTRLDPPRQIGHQSPTFLPDGRHFLFLANGIPSASGIYLGSLDGAAPKRLMVSDVAAAFLPPNLVVFVRQGALMARRLDLARGELTGDAMTLANAIDYDIGFKLGAFSVSTDGHVAYQTRILKRDEMFWVERTTGKESRVPVDQLDVNRLAHPELSPDGRRVAVTLDSQSNVDIWIMDLAGGGFTRFTDDREVDDLAVWSPDSTQIVFSSRRTGSPNLYLKASKGPRGSETRLPGGAAAFAQDWSSDGRFLLYLLFDTKTGADLWALDMKQRHARAVVNAPYEERNGQLSPDGHWLAYQTNVSGRPEIVAVPFPDPTETVPVSTSGGTQPRWHPDGKELYFVALDGTLMAVPITIGNHARGSTMEVGSPVALFQTGIVSASAAANMKPQYAVSRDGRFLISRPEETTTNPITLILNWSPPAASQPIP
jgi:eukaryotic-like serine/threonine-protein kinase